MRDLAKETLGDVLRALDLGAPDHAAEVVKLACRKLQRSLERAGDLALEADPGNHSVGAPEGWDVLDDVISALFPNGDDGEDMERFGKARMDAATQVLDHALEQAAKDALAGELDNRRHLADYYSSRGVGR